MRDPRDPDVHRKTADDLTKFLAERQAETEAMYRTPMWERVLLWVVLAMLLLVVVSGIASLVLS